jgi:threonine dehydrogenase-like Zn-dependent dehydrogenase
MALLTAQVYDAHGANVQITAASQRELGLARQLGFTKTINTATKDWERETLRLTHDAGPRVIIEATGTAKGLETSLRVVRSQGVVALVSILGHMLPVDSSKIVDREIQVLGVSRGPFDKAIDMLVKGRIEVGRLISRHFNLEEGARAFEYASQPDVQKVIVTL